MKNINMKKLVVLAALFCCGVMNSNAQEVPVVYSDNPADIEYGKEVYSAVANYQNWQETKGLRRWKVEAPVGNNTQTVPVLWSANREGPYIGAVAIYSRFDNRDCYGAGLEGGYMRRYWGVSITGTLSNGYEARSSERQKQFTQLDCIGRLYLPGLEFKVGAKGSILRVTPYVEGSFKKRSDFHTLEANKVEIEETDDEWVTTTTTTYRDLDARPHVFGGAVGARVEYNPWGSPLKIMLNADWGKSKNFTYVEQQVLDQVKVQFTIGYNIFNNHGYAKSAKGSKNKYLYEDLGYTRKEVKRHNW